MVLFSKNLAIKSHPIKTSRVSRPTRDFTICWKSSESTYHHSAQRTAHTDVSPLGRHELYTYPRIEPDWHAWHGPAVYYSHRQQDLIWAFYKWWVFLFIGVSLICGAFKTLKTWFPEEQRGGPPQSIFTLKPIYLSFSSYNFPFVCFQNHRRPP